MSSVTITSIPLGRIGLLGYLKIHLKKPKEIFLIISLIQLNSRSALSFHFGVIFTIIRGVIICTMLAPIAFGMTNSLWVCIPLKRISDSIRGESLSENLPLEKTQGNSITLLVISENNFHSRRISHSTHLQIDQSVISVITH